MPINNVGATEDRSALTGDALKNASRAAMKELDKDAFLKLLIAQLSNQDPLNPMEDREFIAQMAQFSSLEQMTNMSKTLEQLANSDKYAAVEYVGKTVAFTKEGATEDEPPQSVAAEVLAVWFDPQKGTVLETTQGDVPLKQIEAVGPELNKVRRTS